MSAGYGPVADFGPLVVETDVDFAIIKTLRLWLPTYLAQAERERDLAPRVLARPEPVSYSNLLDDDEFPDSRMPAILVTTAQVNNEPEIDGAGVYSVGWRAVVTAVVRGRTPGESRALASIFGGSVRRCLVQQQDLGGFASETRLASGTMLRPVADSTGPDRYLTPSLTPLTVYVTPSSKPESAPCGRTRKTTTPTTRRILRAIRTPLTTRCCPSPRSRSESTRSHSRRSRWQNPLRKGSGRRSIRAEVPRRA